MRKSYKFNEFQLRMKWKHKQKNAKKEFVFANVCALTMVHIDTDNSCRHHCGNRIQFAFCMDIFLSFDAHNRTDIQIRTLKSISKGRITADTHIVFIFIYLFILRCAAYLYWRWWWRWWWWYISRIECSRIHIAFVNEPQSVGLGVCCSRI